MTNRDFTTTLQTFLVGVVLVLASLCYYAIRDVQDAVTEGVPMTGQFIETDVGASTVHTERLIGEGLDDWFDRHQEAIDGAED